MEPDRPSKFDLNWVSQWLPDDPEVILDVGAYDGSDARRFKRMWPGAQVHAIEADPRNYAMMIERGRNSGIKTHNVALADRIGMADYFPIGHVASYGPAGIFDRDWRGSGGILRPRPSLLEKEQHLQLEQPIRVPTMTFEFFCRINSLSHVDVVHMDVQGAEGLVLSVLGTHRPSMIFLEISETENYIGALSAAELTGLMRKLGYVERAHTDADVLYVRAKLRSRL